VGEKRTTAIRHPATKKYTKNQVLRDKNWVKLLLHFLKWLKLLTSSMFATFFMESRAKQKSYDCL